MLPGQRVPVEGAGRTITIVGIIGQFAARSAAAANQTDAGTNGVDGSSNWARSPRETATTTTQPSVGA